jgi:hypothetical protein
MAESFVPRLLCVLQHWYELRKQDGTLGEDHAKRYIALNAAAALHRRHGFDALRGAILQGLRGTRSLEPLHLIIGAACCQDLPRFHERVLRALNEDSLPFRLGATYASAFLAGNNDVELGITLTERAMGVVPGDASMLRAAREMFEIRADADRGGRCRRCKRRGVHKQNTEHLELLPPRAS